MSDTLTAQQLANALGLNVDTVRKRAKAGKIKGYQDKNGKWTFLVADFPDLFGNKNQASTPAPKLLEQKLTDVIFVLDRSGSMAGLMGKARDNLRSQIDTIRSAAGPYDRYRISVINFNEGIRTTLEAREVGLLTESTERLYEWASGSTRLHDAILEATLLASRLATGAKQHAFLISVVTDGEENASNASAQAVANTLRQLTATDKYTFAFAGPSNSRHVASTLGFLPGNVTEWEQTVFGVQTLGATTRSSLSTYTRSRSIGQLNSTSFYAAPVTKDADKFANQLDNKLDDISGQVKVERVTTGDPVVISKFCAKKFGSFPKGHVYYQLTESEKVQDYKKLIVQDTTTGNFFSGEKAKGLLGVPNFKGTVKIKPGDLGEFKVFVQSTSVNRKLTPGTAVVYLP